MLASFVLATALGDPLLDDDFESNLDLWNVSFIEADGWSYSLVGSELVVAEILGTVPATEPDTSVWSYALLTSPDFGAVDDFTVGIELGWDSAGVVDAMQLLALELRSGGGRVARVAYHDPWVGSRGQTGVVVDSLDPVQSGANTLDFAGSTTFHVIREGGVAEIFQDGVLVATGEVTEPLTHLEVLFGFVDYQVPPYHSVFGAESLDRIFVLDVVDRSVLEIPAETADTGAPVVGPCGEADLQVSFEHRDLVEGDTYLRDYDIQVTNAGPRSATEVELRLDLPRQVGSPVLHSGALLDAGMSCTLEGSTFVCTWPGPMGVESLDAVIRVERTGGVPSEAAVSVSAAQTDTCPGTNSVTERVPEPTRKDCSRCGPQDCNTASSAAPVWLAGVLVAVFTLRRRRAGDVPRVPGP